MHAVTDDHRVKSSALSPPAMFLPPGGVQGEKAKSSNGLDELDDLLHQAQLYVSLTSEPPPLSLPISPLFPKRDKTRGQEYYHTSSQTTTTDATTSSATSLVMASASPPPRPSRANTDNLNDVYPSQPTTPAQRRISAPMPINQNGGFYADPNEQMPPVASTSQSPSQIRSRAGTTKGKKGIFMGLMSDFLGSNKTVAISTPYDPVHLTHVGFNSSTGEFTGLPKEWQQLLQESGISRVEQEKNPQAVMEIVKFYQEGGGDVWDKMGAAPAPPREDPEPSSVLQSPVSHLTIVARYMRDPQRHVKAPCSCPSQKDSIQPFVWTLFLQTSTRSTPDRFSFSGSVHISAPSFQVSQPEPATLSVKHDQRFTSPRTAERSRSCTRKTPAQISSFFDNRLAFETAKQRSGKNPTATERRCQPVA